MAISLESQGDSVSRLIPHPARICVVALDIPILIYLLWPRPESSETSRRLAFKGLLRVKLYG